MVARRRLPKFDPAGTITFIIVAFWVAAYGYQYISPTFVAPSSLDPLMLLVASAYIGKNTIQRKGRRDDEDDERENA